ncbi:hypothetical protein BD770DRAFT_440447 [Pilaira anomala]|nr:hypothetical protein BD770DRAFT_440447 [Pilaira anomala]
MIQYGPRLLVVGDCQEKFQIKVWNITQLLRVTWDPFDDTIRYEDSEERSSRFYYGWWSIGTKQLKSTVMTLEEDLPYNISLESILRTHLLDTAVNYIAYINLNTRLYLLHEDGHLSAMDIESGHILSTISTHGIAQDVNVVGDSEIIATRLLQSLLP